MNSDFPAFDFGLSPYTGWTRAHWEYILARITYGYAIVAERSGSPARVLYPDDQRGLPDSVDALESFGRISTMWGAWLWNSDNPATLKFQDREINIEELMRRALLDGTNPSNPHTYWGDIGHMDQRIVETADIAVAVWMSRERVFHTMIPAEQEQVMAWLAQVDGKGTHTDNWILFTAMVQVVRLQLGFPTPVADLEKRLMQIEEFYRGDGWYVDGPTNEFELYNAWMFGWHYLLWALIDGARCPERSKKVLARARSFIEGFLHFFGSNGSYPAWGRSIVYRFAALAPFAVGHFLNIAPEDPGLLRRASSGCIRYFYDHGFLDPEAHFVRQGYHGDFPPAGEAYISPGSPYWCCHGLFALTLRRDDSFWTAVEKPLPVERSNYELILPAPGFVIIGRRDTGQVLLLNSRSGQEHDAPHQNYTSKYGKLAYSTHLPFNLLPVHGSFAPDAMISLTRDGNTFGHRLHARGGEVAPGFMWTKFEEKIEDELQPVWIAVLLHGDVQIRLTVIRPTFPVMAFEAPGALGSERSVSIRRRSDLQAGWEYAEAEGQAVSIQRLVGYDSQTASAPFLGQSNINLAYPYAEQPLVHESQASVDGRCLAAASLVRPMPFDPQAEFAGIQVETESYEMFRVQLPEQAIALVAPGETTPNHVKLDNIDVKGIRLRYIRLSKDRDEIAGLGITQISEVADFLEPATFVLKRISNVEVRLTANTGVSLTRQWLHHDVRCIEAMTLDREWLDVTEHCLSGSIPTQLVKEWADRNQRTLVEFRITL